MAFRPSIALDTQSNNVVSESNNQNQVRSDAAAVIDSSAFVFPADTPNTSVSWILAEVKPSPLSGVPVMPAHLDRHGVYVVDEVLPPKDEGQLNILDTLAGKPLKGAIKYSWPSFTSEINNPSRNLWNPFEQGGKIIIKLASQRPLNTEPIGAYFIVPHEFVPYVSNAFDYVKQHPDIFLSNLANWNVDKLHMLIADKNPMLAVASFRTLYNAGQISNDDILTMLKNATALEEAVEIRVLITNSSKTQFALTRKALSDYLTDASSADHLYGFALGLYSSSDSLVNIPALDEYMTTIKRKLLASHETSQTARKLVALQRLMMPS